MTDTTAEAREIVSRLIKIAADVARRRYLPDISKFLTIQGARIEVNKFDGTHADLAIALRSAADEFTTLALRAEQRGAERMKERIANYYERSLPGISQAIRALPLTDEAPKP